MRIEKRKAKKAKSGYTYRVKIDYVDECGAKQTYSKSGFGTKKEARAHGIEIEHELQTKGTLKKECVKTLNECFLEALELEKAHLARSSIVQYMNVFHSHIEHSQLGNTPIVKVNYGILQQHFKVQTTRIEMQKVIINRAMTYAIRNAYIDANPMNVVILNKSQKRQEAEILTYENLEAMVDVLADVKPSSKRAFNSYSTAIVLYCGYYLGLRIGEILALEKSDFDFENGVVYVSKKLEYCGLRKEERYLTDKMKTEASHAVLPIPNELSVILEQWFGFNPYDLVCPQKSGEPLVYGSVRSRLKNVAEKIGLENFHPHITRHAYASNIVRSGCDIKTASQLVRHANVHTTLDVYAHTTEAAMKEAIKQTFDRPKNDPKIESGKLMN